MLQLALIAAIVTSCPPPVVERGIALPVVNIDTSELPQFCKREPAHVLCAGTKKRSVTLPLSEVRSADATIRGRFTYRTDKTMHDRKDYWTSKEVCGDCEDYVLALATELTGRGASGDNMALVMWAPTVTTAHATLAIKTSDAGWIEVGVNSEEVPQPLMWSKGRRFYYVRMDGKQQLTKGELK